MPCHVPNAPSIDCTIHPPSQPSPPHRSIPLPTPIHPTYPRCKNEQAPPGTTVIPYSNSQQRRQMDEFSFISLRPKTLR
ncbi:hypothetical protein P171DRAFT_431347 [Karstenula rhodostoma CBS 690.94]|uniref:Uncharacterized protein n=1 Tax=Karstenula rhodostoma CBS 690.94 TaxID=1392251 RepID=A0A9P4PNC8_9PLEO|nr:hypothetical protein P171DRAFT_431347 [Karstenula rhodostoma CBS 690.94]